MAEQRQANRSADDDHHGNGRQDSASAGCAG
jgi:hypothetical protein